MPAVFESLVTVFLRVLVISTQAAVLAGIVFLLAAAFKRRLSPAWRYMLWMIVVARLAMPAAPSSPLSLFNIACVFSDAPETSTSEDSPLLLPADTGSGERTTMAESSPTAAHATDPIQQEFPGHLPGGTAGPPGAALSAVALSALPIVWLVVALALAAKLLVGHQRLAAHLRRVRPVLDTRILTLLEDCKQEMGILTPITLVASPRVRGPVLFGFVRPRIVMGSSILADLSTEELRHVFLHELAHIKRHDIAVTWLMEILRVLHWFNPFVWFAFGRIRAEREMACDELVLGRKSTGNTRDYGEALIRLASISGPVPVTGFMGVLEKKTAMRARIKAIAAYPSRTAGRPVIALALILLVATTGLTNARRTAPGIDAGFVESFRSRVQRFAGAEEMDPMLAEFVHLKEQQARDIARESGEPLDPMVREYFTAAKQGNWLAASALFSQLRFRSGQYYDSSEYPDLKTPVWQTVLETDLVFHEFVRWDNETLMDYAGSLMRGMGENSVCFGGTGTGRGVLTAFNDLRPASNMMVVTQNLLSDPSYAAYVRYRYGDRLVLPSDTDIRAAFEQVADDATAAGTQETLGLTRINGNICFSNDLGVMKVNEALTWHLFSANKEQYDFYVEESHVIPWMYPYMVPHGLIMKLNNTPIPGRLPDEIVRKDRDFWNARTNEIISRATQDDYDHSARVHAKLRSAIAGMYESRGMIREAEYAYLQAVCLAPDFPEPNYRLANLYTKAGRDADALAVLLELKERGEDNARINGFLLRLSERLTAPHNATAAPTAAESLDTDRPGPPFPGSNELSKATSPSETT